MFDRSFTVFNAVHNYSKVDLSHENKSDATLSEDDIDLFYESMQKGLFIYLFILVKSSIDVSSRNFRIVSPVLFKSKLVFLFN